MLLLADSIAKHEWKPIANVISMHAILTGARKVVSGLGTEMKAMAHDHLRFFKVRIGPKTNGRMIVFATTDNDIVPVLIRLKKDKRLGANMAANNPMVREQIDRNLDRILEDIKQKRYKEFDLGI